MANVKITDLTAYTDPVSTDVLPIVDVGADLTKKVSIADLLENAGSGTAAAPGIAFDGDSDTGIYRPGANQVAISTNGTGRLFIDAGGNVGIGTSGVTDRLQVEGSASVVRIIGNRTDALGPRLSLGKSRGSSAGSTTIVQSGDEIGQIMFKGADGIDVDSTGASIKGLVDGTPGANDMPGALVFLTTSNGNNSPSERMRLDSSGRLGLGTSSPDSIFHARGATGTAPYFYLDAGSTAAVFGINDGATKQVYLGAATNAHVLFRQNNTERMRIDSSGRLLVGTTSSFTVSPSLVQIKGNEGLTLFQDGNYCAQNIYSYRNSTNHSLLYFKASRGTVASPASLPDGDNIGSIVFEGYNASAAAFQTAARIDVQSDGEFGTSGDTTDSPGRLVFSTTADGSSAPTERMRINSLGHLICTGTSSVGNIGTVSFTNSSSSATRVATINIANVSGGQLIVFDVNGVGKGSITTNGSTVAYNTSSDYRLKENVVPLTGAVDRLNQLQVHRFNFIADPDKTVDGFIAHEAQAVVPECVTGAKDEVDADGNPVYQGIDQSKLVPLLTAALQEALAEIESLKARVTALEP